MQTSSYRFLERYSKVANINQFVFYISQYFLELALLDSKMTKYAPSLQASAALYMAMRLQLAEDGYM
jgi:hypothetical protein